MVIIKDGLRSSEWKCNRKVSALSWRARDTNFSMMRCDNFLGNSKTKSVARCRSRLIGAIKTREYPLKRLCVHADSFVANRYIGNLSF